MTVIPFPAAARFAAPEPFPAELEDLAKSHALDFRDGSAFDFLAGLMARVQDDLYSAGQTPMRRIAAAMADPLHDLKEAIETKIAGMAREAAYREALELEEQFASMAEADVLKEYGFLSTAQQRALVWAQVHVTAGSLTGAKGVV